MTRFIPAFLAGISVVLAFSPIFAQDTPSPNGAATSEEETSGRLPPYFRDIVDKTQREKIYEIQMKFDELIKPLTDQIAELKSKESKEIEAVLTDKQRATLAKVKEYYKAEALRRKQFLDSLAEETEDVKQP